MNRVALGACLLGAGTIGTGSLGWQRAAAVGDTRTISLHHVHTGEDLTITYKTNGKYDEDALKKISWVLRDWRKNQAIDMDPHEIDLLWEVYQEVGAKEPIQIICGYRSPSTNEMLRNRSRNSGVARFSQHTLGKAIDFYIPGVPLEVVRAAAMKLQGGGVGYYPTSGSPFVHVDVGNVRAWPRMTREQLAKLFPDGRTVHIPSDGNPLPGYELARADLESGRRATVAQPKRKSLLAALFGTDKDAEETSDNDAQAREPAPASPGVNAAARVRIASADQTATAAAAAPPAVPLPRPRPVFQLAAISKPVPPSAAAAPAPPKPLPAAVAIALSANDIVSARGLWDGVAPVAGGETAGETAGLDLSSARRRLAASLIAARDVTATVSPFVAPAATQGSALAYADTETPALKRAERSAAAIAGTSTVISKSIDTATSRPATERLGNPWIRGLMLTLNLQNSLVVTPIGEQDYSGLVTYMRKPVSMVLMTFSGDPQAGLSTERFAGSAVVFPALLTFEPRRRTANIN